MQLVRLERHPGIIEPENRIFTQRLAPVTGFIISLILSRHLNHFEKENIFKK